MLSRALLHPGPLPPSSHFGLTLERHAVVTGLRYALHHLGRPLLEIAPVKLVRLRLYLDGGVLENALGGDDAGVLIAAALVDPGGTAARPLPQGLRSAAAFHRLRLRFLPRRLPVLAPPAGSDRAALWRALRESWSRCLRATNDALLAELVASLARRERRRRGEILPPILSAAARSARAGGRPPLASFGPPDPYRPSWARALDQEGVAREALAAQALPPGDLLRGRFRETYRRALDLFTPGFHELARLACEAGIVRQLDDAFFLPLETADDLASSEPLRWLEAAIATNRREYAAILAAAEPGDLLDSAQNVRGPSGPRPEWEWAPLLPLP